MNIKPSHQDFTPILEHIKTSKQKIYATINSSLIELYWNIGQTISQKVQNASWGKGVVKELATFIAQTEPELKDTGERRRD